MRAILEDLEDRRHRIESLDVRIFVVMPKAVEPLGRLAAGLGLGFPLCSDANGAVAVRFHAAIRTPFGPWIVPTAYLVNPRGTLRMAQRGVPPAEAVVRTVLAIRQATPDGV